MADIYKNGKLVQHVNNAKIPNDAWKIQAGINPKTNLPAKMPEDIGSRLKTAMRKLIRIQDEQDAVQTFQWYNLPEGISSEELERMLYYRGQICIFYLEPLEKFYFTPYALTSDKTGGIDLYGRFNEIKAIPMSSGTTDGDKLRNKIMSDYLEKRTFRVQKDVKIDELKYEDLVESAVIIHDYTPQLAQTIIPRAELQEAIIDIESDIPCYLRTSLMNSTGVSGMRVNDQTASSNVLAANDSLESAALSGKRFIPIVSQVEMQDLAPGAIARCEEYLESLQAVDNLRLGFHGLDNGGLFQKKAYLNEAGEALNAGKAKSALQDRLSNRQHFCDIVNSIWDLGIWCEPKESAINADLDMDGTVMNDDGESAGNGLNNNQSANIAQGSGSEV